MRAWCVSWIGKRRNNEVCHYCNSNLDSVIVKYWRRIGVDKISQTFLKYANDQADTILELFQSTGSNVLSEYNAPTYYGMDTWALAGAIKYAPQDSTIAKNAKIMLKELWADIAAHYNPYLSVMSGPV
jgi:hypothetical protein